MKKKKRKKKRKTKTEEKDKEEEEEEFTEFTRHLYKFYLKLLHLVLSLSEIDY